MFGFWLQKNNGGWGPNKFRRVLLENASKTFFLPIFPFSEFHGVDLARSRGRADVVGPKVFGMSLSRLETLRATPPLLLQLNFLLRLRMGEKWL